ncbi:MULTISPECIES: DUF3224 domain-containing protein [unclassified Pseudomonas]|jgi:hypothetical protein|uniref:DUF3224 domain-containing protein n=1 Tax=unclassified Pseudomonas TaxID=196821 RepID=UPI000C83924B|nr:MULTISPECIES: DUF3224 domain-containing protein [unclassified Pseudomonas]MDX9669086.1 DUF3224 domain-containing protein [Pseudomonas sp. P8_250]PMQ10057.1 hypothetical protein PseAD21_18255 [Pseudomonas sp. AD21]WPN36869.1 DUF3224 domain-containing protein [Pseudomonas sp. P8_139]WPN41330.1 DUF3224 domain-containing protein [Pseudomonas sp. P8_229]
MEASGTFSTRNFKATGLSPIPEITTSLPVSISTMDKCYSGAIEGVSATAFTAAFDMAARTGSYIALESFKGALNGKEGTFNFIHSASTTGTDRADEFFCIVRGSGTGDLKGISGSGGIKIDNDGTHRIWMDYQLE